MFGHVRRSKFDPQGCLLSRLQKEPTVRRIEEGEGVGLALGPDGGVRFDGPVPPARDDDRGLDALGPQQVFVEIDHLPGHALAEGDHPEGRHGEGRQEDQQDAGRASQPPRLHAVYQRRQDIGEDEGEHEGSQDAPKEVYQP